MAPKNDSSKAPKVAGSKPSTTTKNNSGSHSVGPTTRSMSKVGAQASAQASLLPKSNPAFGANLLKALSTLPPTLEEKDGALVCKEKKNCVTNAKKPSSHPSMPQGFAFEVHQEEDYSSSSDSTSTQGTPH